MTQETINLDYDYINLFSILVKVVYIRKLLNNAPNKL